MIESRQRYISGVIILLGAIGMVISLLINWTLGQMLFLAILGIGGLLYPTGVRVRPVDL
jgi:4-hydroxybenzoate polyprenyltransferase